VRLAYTLFLHLILPVALARTAWRGLRNRGYWRRWSERFGFPPPTAMDGGSAENAGAVLPPTAMDGGSVEHAGAQPPLLWLHAVSVGEVRAAAPLARALLDRHPDHRLLVTTMTPTGSDQVRQLLGARVAHCYAPYDLPTAVRRFLDRTAPRAALIMETELWPNLFAECRARGIPVLVANARMSERSMRRYLRFAGLTRATLEDVAVLAVQSQAEAGRFRALGAPAGRIHVTGSIKFDLELPASLREAGEVLRDQWGRNRRVWIAASTHEGEDEPVLAAFDALRQRDPGLLLVLVPRHPERFAAVARLARKGGRVVALKSEQHGVLDPQVAVLIGDTMGDLQRMYIASDVAFVGGSLVRSGGHNLLEASAAGVPVVFGPHMFNFEEIARLVLEAGAGAQVHGPGALAGTVLAYLEDANQRATAGEAALRLMAQHRGALDRTLEQIEMLLAR